MEITKKVIKPAGKSLKERIGNDKAAKYVRELAERQRAYRASFSAEEHEAFIKSRSYTAYFASDELDDEAI